MIIDSPIISGSLASTGSLTQIGNVVITGSLSVSGPIKGNITGSADSASFATTSSYAVSASFATTAVTSSYPFTLSGSVLYTTTGVPYLSKNYNRPTISIGKNIGSGSFLLYSDPGYNVYIGHEVATFTTESSDTVAIGTQAASQLVGGYAFATMVGSYTGFEGYELGESVLIGYSAGNNLLDGYQVTVVGEDAAYGGRKLDRATLIGNSAGAGTNTGSFSTAVGYNAFSYADKSIGSVFLGAWAGNDLISGSNSIIIGPYSGRNVTLKRNNIIIGTNVSLPTNAQDSINIGGLIFGTGSAWVGVDPTYDDYNANPFSGSANGKIGINQPTPLYSFDVSGSGNYTNGLTVTGSIVATSVTSSLLGTASYAVNANFLDNLDSTSFVYTSSYNVDSSSFSTRVTNTEATASSLVTASGSFSNRVTIIESSYATTGSNLFSGTQGINNIANAILFTSTASLYTDGGARITRDLYVSGTSYFNNVTIYGTQSVNYITSSQLNIGTNIITVNTDTPTVRYGGIAVYDSGSTGLTGSLLWDSENNHWIYTNPSGSTYSGGMMISGPRASARGCEQGTTACALMMGQGGDHITSSAIFHYGNATCFYGNKYIDSSGNSCQAGYAVVNNCLGIGTASPSVYGVDAYNASNSVYFKATSNATIAYYGAATALGTGVAGTFSNHDLALYTNSSEKVRITAAGVACFAGIVCAPNATITNNLIVGGTAPVYLNFNAQASCRSRVAILYRGTQSGDVCMVTEYGTPYLSIGGQENNPNSIQTIGFGFTNGTTYTQPAEIGFQTTSTSGYTCGDLVFATRGATTNTSPTERLRITSTGIACFSNAICAANIISSGAICSSGDGKNLDIGGVAVIRGNGGACTTHYFTTGAANVAKYLQYNATGTAINVIAADNHSYFNSGCYVGVGVVIPRSLVEIQKTSGNTCIGAASNATLTLSQGGAINEISQIGFGYTQTTSPAVIGFITTDAAAYTNGALTFATRNVTTDTTPTERLRITSTGIACFACQVCAPYIVTTEQNIFTKEGKGTSYYAIRIGPLAYPTEGLFLGHCGLSNDRYIESYGGTLYLNSTGNNVRLGACVLNIVPDGANSRVGINTVSPTGRLHVVKTSTGCPIQNPTAYNQIVVENCESAGSADLQFLTSNNAYSHIFFGDTDDPNVGITYYDHSNNSMGFVVNASERFTIKSTGAACFACELTAKSLGTNDLILNNLNHDHANYVDGTRGSWLIQEGACDLFIINQVSCKKYKFNLIEIE